MEFIAVGALAFPPHPSMRAPLGALSLPWGLWGPAPSSVGRENSSALLTPPRALRGRPLGTVPPPPSAASLRLRGSFVGGEGKIPVLPRCPAPSTRMPSERRVSAVRSALRNEYPHPFYPPSPCHRAAASRRSAPAALVCRRPPTKIPPPPPSRTKVTSPTAGDGLCSALRPPIALRWETPPGAGGAERHCGRERRGGSGGFGYPRIC